ncbi:hypothetical protein FOA52_012053 [Chlamydomonas sp. UWO 241]|nr:hypothetical protein FOA52_012053 [Chlamydomonas sp. UWO 241]
MWSAGMLFYYLLSGTTPVFVATVDMWSAGVLLFYLLSGTTPFFAPSFDKIVAKAKSGMWAFKGPAWAEVSSSAKELITSLLCPVPDYRLTAAQALANAWVARGGSPPTKVLTTAVSAFRAQAREEAGLGVCMGSGAPQHAPTGSGQPLPRVSSIGQPLPRGSSTGQLQLPVQQASAGPPRRSLSGQLHAPPRPGPGALRRSGSFSPASSSLRSLLSTPEGQPEGQDDHAAGQRPGRQGLFPWAETDSDEHHMAAVHARHPHPSSTLCVHAQQPRRGLDRLNTLDGRGRYQADDAAPRGPRGARAPPQQFAALRAAPAGSGLRPVWSEPAPRDAMGQRTLSMCDVSQRGSTGGMRPVVSEMSPMSSSATPRRGSVADSERSTSSHIADLQVMMMDITVCVTPVMMYKTCVGASAGRLKLSFIGKPAGYLAEVKVNPPHARMHWT